MKVTVAVPTHDLVPFLFAYDLASLCAYSVAALPEEVPFGINGVSGTYVHAARNELIREAIRQEATHVLWIDSDMRFPRESLVRLFKHRLPMVGINYAQRGLPSGFVAIKKVGSPGEKLQTRVDSTGLEEVEALGFGMVLMEVASLKNMPDPGETPWFMNRHLGGEQWMGEDVHFCDLYRRSGGRIFVDHDLSKECRHIGQLEYTCAIAEREAQEAVAA